MYFDFEDNHPDITPVGSAISWREGVLLSIIVHLVFVIIGLTAPELVRRESRRGPRARSRSSRSRSGAAALRVRAAAPRSQGAEAAGSRASRPTGPPGRRTANRGQEPENPLPFSRGNTPERVERVAAAGRARTGADSPIRCRASRRRRRNAAAASRDTTSCRCRKRSRRCSCRRRSRSRARSGAIGRAPAPGGSLGDALRNLQRYVQREQFDNPGRRRQFGPAIQFDTKGVEFGPWIRRFIAQVKRNWFIPVRGDVDEGARRRHVQRAQGRLDHRSAGRRRRRRSTRSTTPPSARCRVEPDRSRCRRSTRRSKAFFTVTFFYNEDAAAVTRSQQLGLLIVLLLALRRLRRRPSAMNPVVVAVLGPTATGKSALALALAERFGGEIINCDSTAVYRGFDIGTDKVAGRGAARHPASPDRHRRSDRGLHRGAVRARCRRGDPRHPRARHACRSSSAAPASTTAR